MKPFSIVKGIVTGLFVLSLPVLFGTISLRWLVSDVGWYEAGYAKYGVSQRTGISPSDLSRVTQGISSYLLLQRDRVDDLMVSVRGQTQPLFKDRENRHMADVRNLMGGFYNLGYLAAGYALAFLMLNRIWNRGNYWRSLAKPLQWAGGLTLGMFGIFGLLSLVSFDELFLQFHLVSFDNDLWILDPTTDNLIMMFPQGFWYDSAIRLAMATGAQALLALLLGSLLAKKSAAPAYQPSKTRIAHR